MPLCNSAQWNKLLVCYCSSSSSQLRLLLDSQLCEHKQYLCVHFRYDSNSWATPISVQTYRHQNLDNDDEEERGPTPPLRGRTSSPPTVPYSQPSSSSLSSAHHDEMQSILQAHLDELTRAYQYEVAKQAWWGSSIVSAASGWGWLVLYLYLSLGYL